MSLSLPRSHLVAKQAQQICSRSQSKPSSGQTLDQLRLSLQRITAILREESRTPAPHLCLSFAASSQIYSVIARAASASKHETVIREAIAVFGILVDCEEEDFLVSPVFSKALMRFVARVTESASIGDDTEAELIEVLFGVAAKIRVEPEILPVWFNTGPRPRELGLVAKENTTFAGDTQKHDFPLCYLLIDRIHHEGRTGDFARTGLLYIFEAVSKSPDLEDWIIRSDLPTLMASGLGALYSQLSRELSIRHQPQHLPLMLALSDYVDSKPILSAENIFSPTHANHISTFLSHLAFWQDVLEHCKSDSVKGTLLDHFQILFLQQLLYPSLLQSSDTDGGSSVAVLTYMANILDALDHQDLVHMILRYLLAMPDSGPATPLLAPATPTALRRQSSLNLLSGASKDEEMVDPNLFSLVDLILNGITSRNPQTAVAALKLSSVLLNRHTDYTMTTLIKVVPSPTPMKRRTVGALSVESEVLLDIAASVSYDECLDDAYTTALQDIVAPLENQSTLLAADKTPPATLASNDPFLAAIAGLFRSFLTNSVDVNLALTEAVMHLAMRSQISLEGWLAVPASSYTYTPSQVLDTVNILDLMDEEERVAVDSLRTAHRRPHWEEDRAPLLLDLLVQLQSQIEEIRASAVNVSTLIVKRIEILGGVEKDGPISRPGSRMALSRMSDGETRRVGRLRSETIATSYKPGEPRQVGRIRSETVAISPKAPLSRSATPSRVRELAPSPSQVLGHPTASPVLNPGTAQFRSIFQPPPPDNPEDPEDEGNLVDKTEGVKSPIRREHEAETLRRKLRFRRKTDAPSNVFQYVTESMDTEQGHEEYEETEATTSHVLTNVVILHYFLLDLVAVLQTRAILFDEVDFS